jgi:hypothetical protein
LELERSAGRAQSRGGLAAAAAFLERSVALSADPGQRTERALAAAEAGLNAGAYGPALALLAMADAGYTPPVERTVIPAAGEAVLPTLKLGIHMMRQAEFISDHDLKIAGKVAHILCGGNLTPGGLVSEQYYLDLEREAFLSLCGERKTQERIAFTLKNGKQIHPRPWQEPEQGHLHC